MAPHTIAHRKTLTKRLAVAEVKCTCPMPKALTNMISEGLEPCKNNCARDAKSARGQLLFVTLDEIEALPVLSSLGAWGASLLYRRIKVGTAHKEDAAYASLTLPVRILTGNK